MKHAYTFFKGFSGALLGLLILAGCSNALPQAPLTDGAFPAAVLPAGMGRLTISLAGTGTGSGERTLFPSAPVSFSKYELAFTPKTGQTAISPVTFTDVDSYSLSLPTGDWTVEARAYVQIQGVTGITNGDYVAAWGSEDVTVGPTPGNISIDLRGGVDEGKGVFSYTTVIPAALESATLEILDLDEGTQIQSVNLKTVASGSIALDSGYYLLKISRVKGADTTVRTEVIHIYDGLTTEAAGQNYDFSGQSMAKFAEKIAWLAAQPPNTAATPYDLVLEDVDLVTELWKANDPLGLLYEALDGRFVNLDLSACRGDRITSTINNNNTVGGPTAASRPNLDKIVSVILPDNLRFLGNYAFAFSTSLSSIDLAKLTTIGDDAFVECTALTSVDLSDYPITTLGGYAFARNPNLVEIKLPDTLTAINSYVFSECSGLTAIDLPESLATLALGAFQQCTSLESIVVPEKITSINMSTFSRCTALAFVDLPAKLTSIGMSAFTNCTALETLISRNTTPPTLDTISNPFNNVPSSLLIYVPDASVDAYKSAWSAYASQIKPLSELPAGA
jgi:hypothetical protein